jgi:hypothetical protein
MFSSEHFQKAKQAIGLLIDDKIAVPHDFLALPAVADNPSDVELIHLMGCHR